MILTCPECSTRYLSKPGTIGPNGRTVRCAKCENTWFVSAEAAESADADVLALQDNAAALTQTEIPVEVEPTPQAELAFSGAAGGAVSGAHVSVRDKADAAKVSRRRKVIFAIWAIPLTLLAIAAVLAYMFRMEIVNRMPEMATIYQGFGIDVTSAGMSFAPATAQNIIIEGEPFLLVETQLKNLTPRTKPAPVIGFTLHNRSGDMLAEWFVEGEGSLPAGANVPLTTQYPNPPIDGVELRYGFATR